MFSLPISLSIIAWACFGEITSPKLLLVFLSLEWLLEYFMFSLSSDLSNHSESTLGLWTEYLLIATSSIFSLISRKKSLKLLLSRLNLEFSSLIAHSIFTCCLRSEVCIISRSSERQESLWVWSTMQI